MRIAYFGLPLGAWLLHRDGHDVALAVLSPAPAPGGRRLRRALGAARVLEAARLDAAGLESQVEQRLDAGAVDLLVSWYWTRRIPASWIRRARLGGIGAHPSLLPRHRGPNPFYWAIDGGDEETGVTVHRLEETYDTGEILDVARVAVAGRDSWQLARALDRPSLALLRAVVARLSREERVAGRPQSEAQATLAPEPVGDALRVDFSWPTERVLRRIRALSPAPGLALELAGTPLFVTRAVETDEYPAVLHPGEAAAWQGAVVVRTGDGAVSLRSAVVDDGDESPRSLGVRELAALLHARR